MGYIHHIGLVEDAGDTIRDYDNMTIHSMLYWIFSGHQYNRTCPHLSTVNSTPGACSDAYDRPTYSYPVVGRC
jgi:hypothetical protein